MPKYVSAKSTVINTSRVTRHTVTVQPQWWERNYAPTAGNQSYPINTFQKIFYFVWTFKFCSVISSMMNYYSRFTISIGKRPPQLMSRLIILGLINRKLIWEVVVYVFGSFCIYIFLFDHIINIS